MSLKQTNKEHILSALPGTRKEVQERTGLSKTTVQAWITRMHKDGTIRIGKWVKPTPHSKPAASYRRKGRSDDAVCTIKPISNTEKVNRYREKLKRNDPERYELLMQKSIARLWEFKAKSERRCPLMAALYGTHTRTDSGEVEDGK